jgi:hypothetical protein
MNPKIYLAIAIILVVLVVYSLSEHFEPNEPADKDNWVRLYETFTLRPSPPDARWWEFATNDKAYIKKDLKMQLKSYDIKVKRGRVQLWAIYPGDAIASSSALGISGYGDAYTDAMPLFVDGIKPGWQHTYTTNAFKANSAKYQLIADAKDGDHLTGMIDYKCTRVMVIANFN